MDHKTTSALPVLVFCATVIVVVPALPWPTSSAVFVVDWIYRAIWIGLIIGLPTLRSLILDALPLPPSGAWLRDSLLIAVVVISANEGLNAAITAFEIPNVFEYRTWPGYGNFSWIRWTDLTAGLMLVAVSEELLFRVVLVETFERHRFRTLHIYVLGMIVFASAHWTSGLLNIGSAAVGALLLIWLYRRYRNLWPPVIVHFASNVWAFW